MADARADLKKPEAAGSEPTTADHADFAVNVIGALAAKPAVANAAGIGSPAGSSGSSDDGVLVALSPPPPPPVNGKAAIHIADAAATPAEGGPGGDEVEDHLGAADPVQPQTDRYAPLDPPLAAGSAAAPASAASNVHLDLGDKAPLTAGTHLSDVTLESSGAGSAAAATVAADGHGGHTPSTTSGGPSWKNTAGWAALSALSFASAGLTFCQLLWKKGTWSNSVYAKDNTLKAEIKTLQVVSAVNGSTIGVLSAFQAVRSIPCRANVADAANRSGAQAIRQNLSPKPVTGGEVLWKGGETVGLAVASVGSVALGGLFAWTGYKEAIFTTGTVPAQAAVTAGSLAYVVPAERFGVGAIAAGKKTAELYSAWCRDKGRPVELVEVAAEAEAAADNAKPTTLGV